MRRLLALLVAVLAAALAATLIARANAATSTRFRTPDAGAACRIEGAALSCSSLGSAGSVVLRAQGGAGIAHELPWWDASTPVLHQFRHGTLTCNLTSGAILCRNGTTAIRVDGAGFAVAS
jgi:hypothetical protein